jgi:hypothetical protein
MYVKKFFNEKSGAIQMTFDLFEGRIYLVASLPFNKVQKQNGKTRKFDWDNALNYTIVEETIDQFLPQVKDVLEGDRKSTEIITYTAPNVQKGLAFAHKGNDIYSILVSHNKEKRIFDFINKAEATRFYKLLGSFFQNALLGNLIVEGLIDHMKNQKKSPDYKKNNYQTKQKNKTETTEEDVFGFDDNVFKNNKTDSKSVDQATDEVLTSIDPDSLF